MLRLVGANAKLKMIHCRISYWRILPALLALLVPVLAVLLPIGGLLWLVVSSNTGFPYAASYVVRTTLTTIFLLTSVGALSYFIGGTTAWLVSCYEFPGRRLIKYLLLLPLTVPTYISGYIYYNYLANPKFPLYSMLTTFFSKGSVSYGYNTLCVMMIMTLAYYPYVYIVTLGKLHKISDVVTVSRIFGYKGGALFAKVIRYAARPALLLGTALVMVEVSTEYGLTNYYGLDTYVSVMHRLWFNMHDYPSAAAISTMALALALSILFMQSNLRNTDSVANYGTELFPLHVERGKGLLMLGYCLIFVVLGFFLPVAQLVIWSWQTWLQQPLNFTNIFLYTQNSLKIATIAGLLAFLVATIISCAIRIGKNRMLDVLSKIATMGYVAPGALVAISILNMGGVLRAFSLPVVAGSMGGLIYAYLYRFLGVAYGVVSMGFKQVSDEIEHTLKIYCNAGIFRRMREYMPLIVSNGSIAFALVFIDAVKELPITLITRPFNYETLATRTYALVADERYVDASITALITVLASLTMLWAIFKKIPRNCAR